MFKNTKTTSWTLSILVHSLLAIILLRAGYHYAFPEGSVDTVSFDTFNAGGGSPDAKPKKTVTAESALPKETLIKPEVKDVEKSDKPVKKTATKFLPFKEQSDVEPTEKEKTEKEKTEDEKPQTVVPIDQGQSETQETPEAQENLEAQKSREAQETQNTPMSNETPPTNGEDVVGPTGGADADGTTRVARGPMIDESKLSEVQGNEKPSYPFVARLRRQEGSVTLLAFIKKDGTVDLPIVKKSSGFPTLDKSAVTAYAHWHYQPGPSGWVIKTFLFKLNK